MSVSVDGPGTSQRRRSLLGASAIYAVTLATSQALRFLLLPLLARTLPPAELGAFDSVRMLTAFVGPVIGIGLESSVAIMMRERNDVFREREIASAATVLVMLTSALGLLLLIACRRVGCRVLFGSPHYMHVYLFGVALVTLSVPSTFLRNLLRWQHRESHYATLTIAEGALTVALALAFTGLAGTGLMGWLISLCLSSLIVGIGALAANRTYFTRPPVMRFARGLIALGVPFSVMALSSALVPLLTRFVLLRLGGLHGLGVYGVGERVAAILMLAVGGFTAAWGPFYLSRQHAPGAHKAFGDIATTYLFVVSFAAFLLSAVSPWLVRVFASGEYGDAQGVVFPLTLYYATVGLQFISAAGLNIAKKAHHIIWTNALGAGVSIGISLLAIPRFGLVGSSWAAFSGAGVATACATVVSNRYFPVKYSSRSVRILVAIIGSCTLAYLTIDKCLPIWSVPLARLALALGFLAVGIVSKAVPQEHLSVINNLARRRRS